MYYALIALKRKIFKVFEARYRYKIGISMENHFLGFLKSLESSGNKILIESVKEGLETMLESYRVGGYNSYSEKESALDRFNNNIAAKSMDSGNNLLSMIMEADKKHQGKYSVDTEPELDNNPTSQFYRELNKIKSIPKEYKEDDLGFGLDDV